MVAHTTQNILRQRSEKAFNILCEELRNGDYPTCSTDDIDPAVAMMLRYQRAALEGAARLNLRLLARVFAGVGQNRPMVADEFQSWADTLEGLRRSEIIAIAEVHRYTTDLESKGKPNGLGKGANRFAESLVPDPFRNMNELYAICESATRTGLIIRNLDMNLFPYLSTSLMKDLTELADFHDIIRKESA